jgi:hypothetical protein
MRPARYGLIAILLSIVVLPLSARAVPLDDLLATTITQGDALFFSNFSASLFVFNNGRPSDLSEIDVSGITVNGASGLRILGPFDAPTFGTGAALVLGFDVMALNPHQPIHAVTLTVPFLLLVGAGSGVDAFAGPASVSISGMGATEPGCPCAVEGPISATAPLQSDMRRLHIDSFITVVNQSQAGVASASGFDVTFVQSVAEPSIVLLLVFGAGLITAMAHKVRRA